MDYFTLYLPPPVSLAQARRINRKIRQSLEAPVFFSGGWAHNIEQL